MPMIHDRMTRGHTNMGWLDSRHTFSFGGFSDPARMGLRNLRVINEDRVIAGAGFGEHGHAQMDILTYVISGALRHRDSMGNGADITAGELQLMSAGNGITHSEMNASQSDPVHFLQIWLIPDQNIGTPRYDSVKPSGSTSRNALVQVAGPEGGEGVLKLASKAQIFRAQMDEGASLNHSLPEGHAGFLQLISGQLDIEGNTLTAGDGLEFVKSDFSQIRATAEAEFLLFDLP